MDALHGRVPDWDNAGSISWRCEQNPCRVPGLAEMGAIDWQNVLCGVFGLTRWHGENGLCCTVEGVGVSQ